MEERFNFNLLAKILEYPQDDFKDLVINCESTLNDFSSEAKDLFCKFSDSVKERSLEELQELYVKTFELNCACNPYVGVHIFGEDGYKRGTFMARLKQVYKENGLENNSELPDHISQILKLPSCLKDENKYNTFLIECIIDPMNLMLNEFEHDNKDKNQDDDTNTKQYWASVSTEMKLSQKVKTLNRSNTNIDSNPYKDLLLAVKRIAELSILEELHYA